MDRKLVVEPAEAVAHGMPPVRIALDLGNLPVMARTFINGRMYAAVIGPPGGILFFRILAAPRVIEDGDALEALIRDIYADEQNLSLAVRGEMEVQGEIRMTQLFFTGTSMAACANCAMIVSPPSHGASAPGVLLIFGHSGTPDWIDDCLAIASNDTLGQILETLQLDLAVDSSTYGTATASVGSSAEQGDSRKSNEASNDKPKSEAPPRTQPQGVAPELLVKYVDEIRETLKRMGCWSEGMPTGQSMATWTPLQQRMWSVQATLQAMEGTIRGSATANPSQPIFGIVEALGNLKRMLATTPGAEEMVKLLERGPQA